MKIVEALMLLVIIISLYSCGTAKMEYAKPAVTTSLENSMIVDKSKDEVWKTLIPALSKKFFVINNLDKESGIINVSYKGDPEKYVDCGRVTSTLNDMRGKIIYDFPAAKAYQEYALGAENGQLLKVKRNMDLDGRMNIIVEEINPKKTKVTVNTKYVLVRKLIISDVQGRSNSNSETISFNTGQEGHFQGGMKGQTCRCNGELENEILSLLTNKP